VLKNTLDGRCQRNTTALQLISQPIAVSSSAQAEAGMRVGQHGQEGDSGPAHGW
jgi:hypothetical protein